MPRYHSGILARTHPEIIIELSPGLSGAYGKWDAEAKAMRGCKVSRRRQSPGQKVGGRGNC